MGQPDNCYQFRPSALFMYSKGVSPRISLNPMTSQGPCGVCLHGLILISQSVISPQFRLCPHGQHKPRDLPSPFHSDSDQQKDNINHIQPMHSTTCFICAHLLGPHLSIRVSSGVPAKVGWYSVFLCTVMPHILCHFL